MISIDGFRSSPAEKAEWWLGFDETGTSERPFPVGSVGDAGPVDESALAVVRIHGYEK